MEDIKLVPLGTVSPYCKGNSNCPGYLIKSKNNNILLDAGNGITRYMDFPNDLSNLQIILSHLHADHVGEIGSIANASLVYKRLGILEFIPSIYMPYVNSNSTKEEYYFKKLIMNYCYQNMLLVKEFWINKKNSVSNILMGNDLKIDVLKVNHTNNSYGIKVIVDDFVITYTGDVGVDSFNALVNFAKNSDVLIGEATLLRSDNIYNDKHLTTTLVAELARVSKVKRLLLTHFWPEHDISEYLNEAKPIFENTECLEENKVLVLRRKNG